MVPDSSSSDKKDEAMDRDRLILAFKQLQVAYDRQAEVIARYERLYKNKKTPKADVYEELEIQRELVASLDRQLLEKQEDFEARKEEHEAAMEELRLNVEEQSKVEQVMWAISLPSPINASPTKYTYTTSKRTNTLIRYKC